MLGTPRLFVSGPIHGEVRMVEGPYMKVIADPLQYTSYATEVENISNFAYTKNHIWEYVLQRIVVLGRIVHIMLPVHERPENVADKVIDVLLSNAAKYCICYEESKLNAF